MNDENNDTFSELGIDFLTPSMVVEEYVENDVLNCLPYATVDFETRRKAREQSWAS
jgi:hypothetical protein